MATYVSSTTYFDHGDWLGTERARTDVNGAISETCQGLPFGDGLSCSGSDVSPLHFTGKQRDSETGLDYFGARYDSSSVGRLMTPDPLGLALISTGGKALLGHELSPQDWNMYAYSLDSPLTLQDPTGLNACSPKDTSTTDCVVYIDVEDRTTNSKGQYSDQFTNVKNQKQYNATATVWVGKKGKNGEVTSWKNAGTFLARTTPSSGEYGTLQGGMYSGTRIMHNGVYPAIFLTGKGMPTGISPALGGRDPLTGRPYIQNGEMHRGGRHNWAGMYWRKGALRGVSEGCSLVCTSQYPSFEAATGLNAPAPQKIFTIMLGASANGGW